MKRTYPKHIAGIIDEAMARAGLTDSLLLTKFNYPNVSTFIIPY